MAKMSVPEWSINAEDNEDVGGVDIRQTAPGANIGPGIREVMAQIKEWTTAATFTGNTTVNTLYVSSAAPAIRFIETDAGTNEKIFRIISVNGDTFCQSMTDAGASGENVLTFRRGTGVAWESVDLTAQLLLAAGSGFGLGFVADPDTGIGQLAENTVSIFAANATTPRVTVSANAVNLERPTNIAGNTIVTGNVTASGEFVSSVGTAANPAYNFTGNRDTGIYSPTADEVGFATQGVHRAKFETTGNFFVAAASYTGSINEVGFNIDGATGRIVYASTDVVNPITRINGTTAATYFPMGFYYQGVQKGFVRTTASATEYNTSSDERLKDFIGAYDPAEAIAIIRADPVREWTWKAGFGEGYAVGWGAQTSHGVSPDLASPGNGKEPSEEGFIPWGVDQGRRTPYLWAALSWALDKIDSLEARIAALEA